MGKIAEVYTLTTSRLIGATKVIHCPNDIVIVLLTKTN